MQVKTKKVVSNNVLRVASAGEIKEVIIKEDILDMKNASVLLCYRGENSSGIVELSVDEIKNISREVESKIGMIRDVIVVKSPKSSKRKVKGK